MPEMRDSCLILQPACHSLDVHPAMVREALIAYFRVQHCATQRDISHDSPRRVRTSGTFSTLTLKRPGRLPNVVPSSPESNDAYPMSIPVILEDLQAAFPGWCIWRSSAGRLWATRNGRHLTDEELGRGLCQTIDADDTPGLAQQLRDQEGRES